MLNPLKFLWRSYSKKPPKAINPRKSRKKPPISSPSLEKNLPNQEPPEVNSLLSLKFQEFIKNQKNEDLPQETKEKLTNSAYLDKISKNLFAGQVVDLEGLSQDFAGEVEEFEKSFGVEEDPEIKEMFEKIAEEMKKDQENSGFDGKGTEEEVSGK